MWTCEMTARASRICVIYPCVWRTKLTVGLLWKTRRTLCYGTNSIQTGMLCHDISSVHFCLQWMAIVQYQFQMICHGFLETYFKLIKSWKHQRTKDWKGHLCCNNLLSYDNCKLVGWSAGATLINCGKMQIVVVKIEKLLHFVVKNKL